MPCASVPRMGVRFFKKRGDSAVPISSGKSVKFTSIDGGLTAFFATDQPGLAAEFEKAMTEGRSALTEISAEEFHRDYAEPKKNGLISKPPYREEISRGKILPSSSDITERLKAIQPVVGVVSPAPVAVEPSPAAMAQAQAQVNADIAKELPAEYKPVVGKRKRASAKP